MKVTEFAARQTIRMAESLAHFVGSTPEDRLVWHVALPGSAKTRSAMELISECVNVNHYFAEFILGADAAAPGGSRPDIQFRNGQDAQEQLVMSAMELAQAIRAMTDADLLRTYPHPKGPISGENILLMPYRNMAYHAGQINFIQTLYGDSEFHVPPTWR